MTVTQNPPAAGLDVQWMTAISEGLNSMAQGLCLLDANLIIVTANKAFSEILEVPEDLVVPGKTSIEEVFRCNAEKGDYGSGDVEEQVARRMAKARKKQPHHYERVRPNGKVIEVHGNPVSDGGFISIYTDVTEKHQAERALEVSEASLAEAQELSHIGSFVHDFSDVLYHWSDETSRILGYAPEKVDPTYANYINRVHPDDLDNMLAVCADAKADCREYTLDYRICRPDGEIRHVRERARYRQDDEGKAQYVIGTLQDMTDTVLAQEQLKDSEARFRGAFAASHGTATISDLETGCYVDVNDAWLINRGYERHEVIGKSALEINIWGSEDNRNRVLADLAAKGYLENYPVQTFSKSGTARDMLLNAHIIKISGRKLLFISGTDVTEQLKAEAQLLRAKEEAERSNRAKSEFLASMSHELRTPLNAILGFAQLMQHNPREPLSSGQNQHVESILEGGDHLLTLVNEILDLSEIEADRAPLSVEDVNANDIIESCVEQLAPLGTPRGIHIENDLKTAPPFTLQTDAFRFKQILINLLSNAIKYNKDGGRVRLQAHATSHGYLHLSVSDDGIGIDKSEQPEVFQLFHRLGTAATLAKEGSGIGLHVAKLLVERMAGQIGFDSTPGQGSTFWILLPLADNQQCMIWDERLRVGIDAIDRDHQTLVSMINEMAILSIERKDLGAKVLEMTEHCRIHLHREAEIIRVCDHPNKEKIIGAYRKIEAQIDEMVERCHQDPSVETHQQTRQILLKATREHLNRFDPVLVACAEGKELKIKKALATLEIKSGRLLL
ncbi:PAS-domain containing protein [Rhodovibrionaceae bacterium A322]